MGCFKCWLGPRLSATNYTEEEEELEERPDIAEIFSSSNVLLLPLVSGPRTVPVTAEVSWRG